MEITKFILLEFAFYYILGRDSGHQRLHLCNTLCISWQQVKPFEQIQQLEDCASDQERSLSALNDIENLYTVATIVAYFYAGMHTALNVNRYVI